MGGGKTIPILRITPQSVSIETNAINSVLDQVGDRPFALYSINGPKRTGKSFMLNKFVQYLHAKERRQLENWFEISDPEKHFHWRGGTQRDTIGINIWSKPVFTKVQGRDIAILLMDTQGSYDDQTTMQQNAVIFAVSALLSSVLIFNIMKDIGEDTLQFLQFFSGFAKMASSEGDSSTEESFQKLVFLIRDMEFNDLAYGYYDKRTCPSGRSANFFDKLVPNASHPTEVRLVREHIQSTFNDIGIYALPHPGRGLTREDRENKLEEDFKEHTIDFVELMLKEEKIQLKCVGGVEVTGKTFKKYVQGWAKLFHSNDLPALKSIFETAAEMQGTIATSEAMLKYEKEMKNFVSAKPQGVAVEVFNMKHIEIAENSVVIFHMMKKIGGVEYEARFLEELEVKLEYRRGLYESINNENLKHETMRMEFLNRQSAFEENIRATEEKLKAVATENVAERAEFIQALVELNKNKDDMAREMREMMAQHSRQMAELNQTLANAGDSGGCKIL